jgi:hypothetical protein
MFITDVAREFRCNRVITPTPFEVRTLAHTVRECRSDISILLFAICGQEIAAPVRASRNVSSSRQFVDGAASRRRRNGS